MKIGICISGHLRTFDKSLKNIKEYIINPLKEIGEVCLFISSWEENLNLDFIDMDCNIEMENIFTQTFKSNNYLKYSGLCNHLTCNNSASMWYKCKKVFDMATDCDVIFRIRPDIIYDSPLDISLVKESESSDKIYMANFHGKYESVTKGMMDHFAFGNKKVMSVYMNTYNNIKNYVNDDNLVHTAEGFLFESIKNIDIERININYSVYRLDGNIEKVI